MIGDLIIKLKILPDKQFKRRGNDIVSYYMLSIADAVLGKQVKINTI